MALSDVAIKNAKPKAKPYKLADEKALYLEVMPSGAKYWRLKYRVDGKEKRLALGVYPEVGLKEARAQRDQARKTLAGGIDPGAQRKAAKISASGADSFETLAREWHAKFADQWTPKHAERVLQRLAADLFPWLGTRPVNAINAPELLGALRRIEARGAVETAHRAMQSCGQVFRYAIATGRAERNPAADLRGALAPVGKKRHHASVTDPKAITQLLRDIDAYQGALITRCALQLAPLVFVRPGELRHAEWSEIDTQAAEWRIPAAKMKMRAQHIVPLSTQALAILAELQPLTGSGRYLFPSLRSDDRPMSENTVLAALRRLGYDKDTMTGHGFRHMASTRLNESHQFHPDAIERQLAHAERDEVRAAYNYAEHLPERRRMMQWWADYLDGLKAGAEQRAG